jgi:RND superfamily putative drug exporter
MSIAPTGSKLPPGLRRPRLTIAVAALCIAVLGVIGLGVERDLRPTSLAIPGTSSAHGEGLARSYFGNSVPFAVLLSGPGASIDRQGPQLVSALRRQPAATVIAPWDAGSLAGLRLGARRALVLVDFHQSLDEAIRHAVPRLEAAMATNVRPPLVAVQSSFATISRALQQESLASSERAELLAAPLLILILLLVFRSLVAALLPLLFGAAAVFAGRGVLVLLASLMRIDALSLVVCTMMGLALGVDYSLLIVSRFREELAVDGDPARAALRTRRSAGRTTIFAGSTLFLAIFASAFFAPGALLVSLATALTVVAAISIAIAWGVLPALLSLLGERVNAVPIGRRRGRRIGVAAFAAKALRRPLRAALLIAVPLLLLAAPALGFATGAPGVDELPPSSQARVGAETISRAAGPGWEAPFWLLAATRGGPVTTGRRLEALLRWQRRIAGQPRVAAVIGPAPIARASRSLRGLGRRFSPASETGPARLSTLGSKLVSASHAVEHLRAGIAAASAGGALIGAGSDRARQGASLIGLALRRASAKGGQAAARLARLRDGAVALAAGQRQVQASGFTLGAGLGSLSSQLRGEGLGRAHRLASSLASAARAAPELRPQAEQAAILTRFLASSREEAQRLRGLAATLNEGLRRLSDGGRRLSSGVSLLSHGAAGLNAGLGRLGGGEGRLTAALARLQGGAGALQHGLSEAFSRADPLEAGLRRAGGRVSSSAHSLAGEREKLMRDSPGIFHSGYLVLSALEGAPKRRRNLAQEAVDLSHGGRASRMLVVPSAGFNSAGSRAVQRLLLADAARLGRESGLQTGVAGGPAVLNDYGTATRAGLPLVVTTVIVVTLLVLIVVLRAPLLALLAVALNLLSVGAALGVVTLLCKIPTGYPLGGHPYIDTVGGAAIFAVTFGLSIDYAVFLIARMRERRQAGAENAEAIAFGLERTAGLITGAAAIMAVVFVAFASAPVATVSQMGVGLTVAILLDATVVRIVLLPALMLLLGERVWHVPGWLDRILPQLDFEAGREAAAATTRETNQKGVPA